MSQATTFDPKNWLGQTAVELREGLPRSDG
jgi:hypothetical protein